MTVTQLDSLREQLKDIRCQHRELDQRIEAMQTQLYADSLELKRLKQRKLKLKDMIVRLESQLIPDLNA